MRALRELTLRLLAATVVAAVATAFVLASPAVALPGDPDPSFGNGGAVITDVGTNESAADVAIQLDGKILAAGHAGFPSDDFLALRYRPSGLLDVSFDGDGWAQTGFGANEQARGVAIQGDDFPVLAGGTSAGPNPDNFALVRHDGAGALDPNFSGDGRVFDDAGVWERGQGVVIQSNGRIVVVANTAAKNFLLARYSATGVLDPSFDGNGIRSVGFGGEERSFAVAIQPDGKIVAAGFTNTGGPGNNFALARLNANGSLDPAFDGDGRVSTDFGAGDRAFGVALQPDGRIVAVGSTGAGPNPDNLALASYLPDGSLDPSFGGDGRVITDLGPNDGINDVAIQADGRVVVTAGDDNLRIARYETDGGLDPGFGVSGVAELELGGFERALAVAIQPDGKIVAAGDTNVGPNPPNVAVVRYEGGDPPGSDGGSPPDGGGGDGDGAAGGTPTCRGREATVVAKPGEVTRGTRKVDVIVGTPKRDRIKASGGRDVVCSARGKDRVNAGPGRDVVLAGGGRDRVAGGRGNDRLRGQRGNDRLRGGKGRDLLVGGKGRRDRCNGGPGKNRIKSC